MRVPWGRLWQEALRNHATGRVSSVVVMVAAALCVWSSGYLEGRAVESTRNDFGAFNTAGGFLYVIAAPSLNNQAPEPFSRHHCERLDLLPGVASAGSAGAGTIASTVRTPGERFDLVAVTSGMHDVIRSYETGFSATADDLVIEPDRLTEIGVGSATGLALEGYGLRPVRTARLQTIGGGYIRSVFGVVAPVGPVESCVVALEPRAEQLTGSLTAGFGRTDLIERRVLAGASLAPSALDEHAKRDSRHIWWIAAGGFALVARFVLWTRRTEIALYPSFGVSSIDTRLILTIELLIGVVLGSLVGAAAARLTLAGSHPNSLQFGWYGAALAMSGLVLACCVVPFAMGMRDPMAKLKDR